MASPAVAVEPMDREAAILSLRPRIKWHMRRYSNLPSGLPEDLRQQAWLGAIEAVDKFDPRRGVKLSTLADRLIAGRIIDCLRKVDPLTRADRKKVRAGEIEQPGRAPDALATSPAEFVEQTIATKTVRSLMEHAGLSERERQVIIARYFGGRTQAQLAAEFGVTQGAIGATQDRALKKLRAAAKRRIG